MPTPLPRKRFQIHLSTAIMTMFVAGGLIWANVRKQRLTIFERIIRDHCPNATVIQVNEDEWQERAIHGGNAWSTEKGYYFGWPLRMHSFGVLVGLLDKDTMLFIGSSNNDFSAINTLSNLGVAIFALVFAAICSEWLIRRRAAQKDA